MSSNSLVDLPDCFSELKKLVTINLSHNILQDFPMSLCWNCRTLVRNELTVYILRTFKESITKLLYNALLVARHKVVSFQHKLFLFLKVFLDASHNKLEHLPIGCSIYWKDSIKSVNLSHNQFTEILQDVAQLTKLEMLDLSYNQIAQLPEISLWSCYQLQNLNLSYNSLTVLSNLPVVDAKSSYKSMLQMFAESRCKCNTVFTSTYVCI